MDISYNSLPQSKKELSFCVRCVLIVGLVPPCFYRMEKLKRLDASHNSLTELSSVMGWFGLGFVLVDSNGVMWFRELD